MYINSHKESRDTKYIHVIVPAHSNTANYVSVKTLVSNVNELESRVCNDVCMCSISKLLRVLKCRDFTHKVCCRVRKSVQCM